MSTNRENLIKFAQTVRNLFSKLVENVNNRLNNLKTDLETYLDSLESKLRNDCKTSLGRYWAKVSDTNNLQGGGTILSDLSQLNDDLYSCDYSWEPCYPVANTTNKTVEFKTGIEKFKNLSSSFNVYSSSDSFTLSGSNHDCYYHYDSNHISVMIRTYGYKNGSEAWKAITFPENTRICVYCAGHNYKFGYQKKNNDGTFSSTTLIKDADSNAYIECWFPFEFRLTSGDNWSGGHRDTSYIYIVEVQTLIKNGQAVPKSTNPNLQS